AQAPTSGPVEAAPPPVAPAPTAAAAAAAPLAAEAPVASSDAGVAAPAPIAAPAGGPAIIAPEAPREPAITGAAPAAGELRALPTQPPVSVAGQQQSAPLKAGEVDDNRDFAAYLDYLRAYGGPQAHTIDVAERYILTVTNDRQQPVLDARVRLFEGQQQVFEGRTVAGGKTIVLPRALGLSANAASLRVQIEKGNSTTEGTLERGQDSTQSFVLPGAVALPATPRLDVLFLLDATGSMGDEIAQIQQTIISIAERIDQIQPRPELHFGLVSYRDRGDDYVTRVDDFTTDVAAFQQRLLATRADGGGDEPESLNEGLHAAIQRVGWADDAVRLTFLVADAPPHLDYAQDYDYVREAQVAVSKGIKVYTIAASNTSDEAEYVMRQISQQTLGHFIFLTYAPGQNSGAPGDTTTHHVDPQAFSVERLDDLVVQVVQRELALAQGVS
ncbi:MAG TPA: vWA domain-containing protein, partial [Roseiflexaceae bacterium]|nr:vWA domain-containing protein [Roseiflexaceae bacterium]